MRSIRSTNAAAVALVTVSLLVGCGGPPVSVPSQTGRPEVSADATQPPATTSDAPTETLGQPSDPGVPAAEEKTCDLFRQFVEGGSLSTRELQALVNEMADAVMASQNPELMGAVVDLGNGYVNSDPQRFALGMRRLSVLCKVPYQ